MMAAAADQLWKGGLEHAAICGALVATRLSGLMLFTPVLSSPAIAPRVKAALVLAMTLLIAPAVAVRNPGAVLSVGAVVGELGCGLLFGLALTLLVEMVLFASTLLAIEFSFSLVNLLDPVSRVETPVLGQLLGWVTTLVLLGAGLHRTVLRAVIASFTVLPPGHITLTAASGLHLAEAAGCIFLGGVQLASPVLAAGLIVEVAVALVSRMAPQIAANSLSVPIKTLVSYGVLVASLAVWPLFLERSFLRLLGLAEQLVMVHA